MASLIAIPLKKTNEVDLVKPLKNLFSGYCISADEPVQYDNALTELNKTRLNSTWRTLDKHESSLEIMTRYYDQLTFLEEKCPAADFPVPFKWKDAFDKGSFFSGTASLTMSNLLFERVCILFNIAAMESQIAVGHATDIRNDEGLKLAAKYFQMSSGTFQHVRTMIPQVSQDPTPDLQPDTLLALQSLMLAQAQECFFYKAVADSMKETVITKIAAQCDDLFGEALKMMHKESTRVLWDKEWLSTVAGKQVGFQALSQYYQSLVCKATKQVGEEIARLQHATELLKLAEVRGGISFNAFKDYNSKVAYAHEEAKKDNDFIYHARVPEIKSLPPISKAAIANPTPLPAKLNPTSQDLFHELLPLAVQQAVQTFETRKIEIISIEKAKIQSCTQILNELLASLNLPAALEDTTGSSLPPSLREKADAVLSKGGMDTLQLAMNELPDLLKRNKEILDECDKMLRDEEESDQKLRNQFKARWTRTPSTNLNEPLKASIRKYTDIINSANNSDNIVREKFGKHREKIYLLCLPEDELLAQLPTSSPPTNSKSSSADELRGLMSQVKQLFEERNLLKEELENPSIDMKVKFLSALAQDGSINEQAISVETLGEVYGSIQKRLQENLGKQEKLIPDIQRVNAEFCKQKHGTSNREAVLSDLAAAHDAYMEIADNVDEGTKFYNNLTQLLVVFQNKIGDFCFARKTEREELCKELQTSIVNEANKQRIPDAPAHHSQPARPARPPPPSTGSTGSAPATAPIHAAANPQAPYPYQPNPMEYPTNMTPYPAYPMFPMPYPVRYQTYPAAYPPTGYQQPPPPQQQPPQPQPGQFQGSYPQQPYYPYYQQ